MARYTRSHTTKFLQSQCASPHFFSPDAMQPIVTSRRCMRCPSCVYERGWFPERRAPVRLQRAQTCSSPASALNRTSTSRQASIHNMQQPVCRIAQSVGLVSANPMYWCPIVGFVCHMSWGRESMKCSCTLIVLAVWPMRMLQRRDERLGYRTVSKSH
jgi:hypothetical protein